MKRLHLLRLFILALCLSTLTFVTGWKMGQNNYKQKAVAMLNAGKSHEAVKLLYEWQQRDSAALNDPLFFMVKAMVHIRNGRQEAAAWNMNKAIEVAGRE